MESASDESLGLISPAEVEAIATKLRHLNSQAQAHIESALPVARQILASFQHRSVWRPWGWKYLRPVMRNIERETRIHLAVVEQYAAEYQPAADIVGIEEWCSLACYDANQLNARQRQHLHHLQRRFTRRLRQQGIDHQRLLIQVGKLRVISGHFRQITSLPLPVESFAPKVSQDS